MQWTYYEYQAQPEWFIVGLIRHFREQDQNEDESIRKILGKKK